MLSHEDHAMMTTFEIVPPGSGDRVALPTAARTGAVIGGGRVQVPLDTLTSEEALRTRELLAAQARRPGSPGPVPAEPLKLAAGAAQPFVCRLEQQA
jgi:hypothetical protein